MSSTTALPQFLGSSVYLDFRPGEDEALRRLASAVDAAPDRANPVPPRISSTTLGLDLAIERIQTSQAQVTASLGRRDVNGATKMQDALDPIMRDAEQTWRYEVMVLVLGGYHRKNRYMLDHWDELQAGRSPDDPRLLQAERCFFDALFVDPFEISSLNGLGSVLLLERELEAAEFFVRRAIGLSNQQGIDYSAANQDLQTILWFKGAQNQFT